jgi:N-acetylneuraminic acid mutarotase
MLVFAGLGMGFDPLNDLWAYRPATNSWTELLPPRPRPLPVFYHSAVWDPAAQRMLVFGGADPLTGRLVDELWSFSLESGGWTRIQAPGQPPARLSHSAVWDESGARMLVFGGGCGAGCYRADLWAFQPATSSWTQLFRTGPIPVERGGQSAVWDAARGRLLVFGGTNGLGTLNDLWAYSLNTNAWTELLPRPAEPVAREQHVAVWDERDQMLLLFGGYRAGSEFLGDLWAYRPDVGAWTGIGGDGPSARSGASAAWDSSDNRLLLFGGYGRTGYQSDLWSFTPATGSWTELPATGDQPPPREDATAVWDTVNRQLLLYGGRRAGALVDDLWAYRPATDTWVELDREGAEPPPRFRHSAVWDPGGERMLLFGGYGGAEAPGRYLDDAWSYSPDSHTWAPVGVEGETPAPRAGHVAVWDSPRQGMLVWGGFAGGVDYLDDLWELSPADGRWQRLEMAGGPPARASSAGAWDPVRRQLLVHGGRGSALSSELWSYGAR